MRDSDCRWLIIENGKKGLFKKWSTRDPKSFNGVFGFLIS